MTGTSADAGGPCVAPGDATTRPREQIFTFLEWGIGVDPGIGVGVWPGLGVGPGAGVGAGDREKRQSLGSRVCWLSEPS